MGDWKVVVDGESCSGCRECVDSCPGDVFDLVDGVSYPSRAEDCHGCHTCEDVCEEEAVNVREM